MLTARRTMVLRGDAPPAPVEPAPSPEVAAEVAALRVALDAMTAERDALREANAGLAAALEAAPARPTRSSKG